MLGSQEDRSIGRPERGSKNTGHPIVWFVGLTGCGLTKPSAEHVFPSFSLFSLPLFHMDEDYPRAWYIRWRMSFDGHDSSWLLTCSRRSFSWPQKCAKKYRLLNRRGDIGDEEV